MSYHQYENFEGLRIGRWFKRAFRTPKFIKRVMPKFLRKFKPLKFAALPFTLPLATVGILKAKDLNVGWGGSFSRGLLKTSRIAAIAGAVVVGGMFLGPAIMPAISKGGTIAIGGLKWVGGALKKVPAGLSNVLAKKGFPDVKSAPIEAVLDAALEIGAVSQSQMRNAYAQTGAMYTPEMIATINPQTRTRIEREYFAAEDPTQAGMVPTTGMNTNTMLLIGGLGIVAVFMTQRR